LAGQVADRELKDYQKPDYPEWAKRDGVEGAVTLRFYVLPDGRVKDNIFVEKTSGFGDFDNNAVNALRQWRFEPLAGAGEQWGVITFNFRLSDNR
jgi:TonB family protein